MKVGKSLEKIYTRHDGVSIAIKKFLCWGETCGVKRSRVSQTEECNVHTKNSESSSKCTCINIFYRVVFFLWRMEFPFTVFLLWLLFYWFFNFSLERAAFPPSKLFLLPPSYFFLLSLTHFIHFFFLEGNPKTLNESHSTFFLLPRRKKLFLVILSCARFHEKKFFFQLSKFRSCPFKQTQKSKTCKKWSQPCFFKKFSPFPVVLSPFFCLIDWKRSTERKEEEEMKKKTFTKTFFLAPTFLPPFLVDTRN